MTGTVCPRMRETSGAARAHARIRRPARREREGIFIGACFWLRQEQTPAPFPGKVATLTLHFCDEVENTGARNRTGGVSLCRKDVRTPHISSRRGESVSTVATRLPRPLPSPEGVLRLVLARAPSAGCGSGLMRYRSATVADFHGIPSILQSFKRTTNGRRLRRAFL